MASALTEPRSPDRLAIISDIHGNLPALEAVLADIRRRGIERIYCLGDLAGKGPSGAEAVDICREACVAIVQGNWDVMAHVEGEPPFVAWHRAQLGPERVAYLAALPPVIDFRLSGRTVRLFHASQKSAFHRVRMDDTREALLAMFENTEFTGHGSPPNIVGYGDIHVGFIKNFDNRCLFNAGSVGNPLDVPQACYASLEGTFDGETPTPWSVTLQRVPYDVDEAIRQAATADMPEFDAYANELRTARYRGLTRLG